MLMADAMDDSLLTKKLVYVTGKGGVGKTTVACALGLAAAARGLRTIVCEVSEQRRAAEGLSAAGGSSAEVLLEQRLTTISIDPSRTLEEWLSRQLASQTLVRTLGRSQAFQYFIAAAPGIRELITIGKIWDLSRGGGGGHTGAYDLVIVDAPASGHGVAMLNTPQTFRQIARVGPVARQADKINGLLTDAACTGYVAVTLPEETPVNETLELEGAIERAVGVPVSLVVANSVRPRRFSEAEERRLQARLASGLEGAGAAVLRAALAEERRARAHSRQLERLAAGSTAPVVTLPFVPEVDGRDAYRLLADSLGDHI